MILNINNRDIQIDILYKPQNKHMYMRVKEGIVYISTFKRIKESEISKIVQDNFERIVYLLDQNKEKSEQIIHFLGKQYDFEIYQSQIDDIKIENERFHIGTKSFDPVYIKMLINDFYVKQTSIYINNIIDEILLKFQDIIDFRPRIKYKYLKTAYGKCYPKRREITFSGICMKLEPKYIEYVIYHELAHFKYLGHQKDFYEYLESKLPNAIKYSKQIRRLKYKDIY